ncbi:secretin N-terminal domain-containing protein [Janthinobacterium agaricidamnosum]|uniref:Bacterial type II and III secretion system family protein n=1 Tax=Janthinobacterium agaricidamnosum NBRC 102515 = DSM 9628 TaxID=1349767 RepID=W0VBD6_9BURK|nr:secretin N-terminal domain-containing protein [Janthinobacterium agaricidamnosum]CDG84577.1 bacterial type II and III secretion system family protein [Janthinobacterium agaricidamnosum NBRC 102515 = DSM 9628]
MLSPLQTAGDSVPYKKLALAAAVALFLSGCAGTIAYRDGNDLIAKNQIEAGLKKFQDAIAADPRNAKYRSTYLNVRDSNSQRYLQQADAEVAAGKIEPARESYRHVLLLDPQNERALAGLRTIDIGVRHAKMLSEASAAIAARQYEPARQRLNAILTENPNHEKARALLHDLNDKTAPPLIESGLARSYKQPISIEFRDAPLKQVFEVIARRSGLNFVFDKDVKADTKTSIFLKNSTVESAIYYLLMTNQLEQQVMDANTVLIYPNVAAKLKEYQEVMVKTFFLSNADAKTVSNTLRTILKTRDIVVDEKLNLVIMRDTPEAIKLAERIVALQDVPEAEVMLEVEVLEVQRNRTLNLGINWPQSLTLSPLTTSGGSTLTLADLGRLNNSKIGVGNPTATVNAAKIDADVNLLANPRIRVRNKEKAKVVIGDKVPVITSTISPGISNLTSESVSYIDVGLTLNVEPTIYLNGDVAIRVALEVSNLGPQTTTNSGSKVFQIGTRQASTLLQLKDGENQVLAGLLSSEERSGGSKVPGIGEFPVLDRLFGTDKADDNKTEIVLSITPHLIRKVQRPEAQDSEFSAGTEGSFRRRPDLSIKGNVAFPSAAASGGNVIVSGRGGSGSGSLPQAPSQSLMAPPVALPQSIAAPETTPTNPAAPAPQPESPQPQSQSSAPVSSSQPTSLQGAPLSSSQPVPVQSLGTALSPVQPAQAPGQPPPSK